MAEKQTRERGQEELAGNQNKQNQHPNTIEAKKVSYGENFQAHLLEEYKMYVEMMDRVTERRG